jgi:hypothetical protein
MGWCPSLKELPKGMVKILQENGLVYMVVDHTIALPSNFPLEMWDIIFTKDENILKYQNIFNNCCFVLCNESFESYLEDDQPITKTIAVEHDNHNKFSRFCEIQHGMCVPY